MRVKNTNIGTTLPFDKKLLLAYFSNNEVGNFTYSKVGRTIARFRGGGVEARPIRLASETGLHS